MPGGTRSKKRGSGRSSPARSPMTTPSITQSRTRNLVMENNSTSASSSEEGLPPGYSNLWAGTCYGANPRKHCEQYAVEDKSKISNCVNCARPAYEHQIVMRLVETQDHQTDQNDQSDENDQSDREYLTVQDIQRDQNLLSDQDQPTQQGQRSDINPTLIKIPHGLTNKWGGQRFGDNPEDNCRQYLTALGAIKNSKCYACGFAATKHRLLTDEEPATIPREKIGTQYGVMTSTIKLPEKYRHKKFFGKRGESFAIYRNQVKAKLPTCDEETILTAMVEGLMEDARTFYNGLPYQYSATQEGIEKMVVDFSLRFPTPSEEYYNIKMIATPLHNFNKFLTWVTKFEAACTALKLGEKEKAAAMLFLTESASGISSPKLYNKTYEELKQYLQKKCVESKNKKQKKPQTPTHPDAASSSKGVMNKGAEERSCKFFAKGECTRTNCRFKHYSTRIEQEKVDNNRAGDIQQPTREVKQPPTIHEKREDDKKSEPLDEGVNLMLPKIQIPKSVWEEAKKLPERNDKKGKSFNQSPKLAKALTWPEALKMMIDKMDQEIRQNPVKVRRVTEVLEKNKEAFDLDPFCSKISTEIPPISIKLRKPIPPTGKIRKEQLPHSFIPAAKQILESRLRNGIIKKADTNIVSKTKHVLKSDGTLRPTCGYTRINEYIHVAHTAVPIVKQLVDKVKGHKYYIDMDMQSFFSQLGLQEDSKYITGFIEPITGDIYVFNSLPQGLKIGTAEAQKVMNDIFGKEEDIVVFVDNLTGYGDEFDETLITLEKILTKAIENDLRFKPQKCNVMVKCCKMLGFGVSEEGSKISEDMLNEIRNLEEPGDEKTLMAQLSLFSFSRDYIKNLGKYDGELRPFVKKFKGWGEKEKLIWQDMKEKACENHPLKPWVDGRDIILQIDGSKKGWGAALLQRDEQKNLDIIGWASGKYNKYGLGYGPTKGELWALKEACRKFNTFLKGRKFLVQTDCKALTYGLDKFEKEQSGYMSIWAQDLIRFYDFDIEHIPGKDLILADALSRLRNRPGEEMIDKKETKQKERTTVMKQLENDNETKTQLVLEDDVHTLTETDFERIRDAQKDDKMCAVLRDMKEKGRLWVKNKKIIIPSKIQNAIIEEVHRVNGHPSIKETTRILSERFFFPKMPYMVREHVKLCKRCMEFNPNNQKKVTSLKTVNASRPFEVISVDPIPQQMSKQGYDNMILVVDNFSRLLRAFPTKDATTLTITKILEEEWFNSYQKPRIIRSDSATTFSGTNWSNFCQAHDIEHYKAPPKHQHSAGMAEPNWKSLKTIMGKMLADNPGKEWTDILGKAVSIFNNRRHSATKMKPIEAAFGSKEEEALNPIQAVIQKLARNKKIYEQSQNTLQSRESGKMKFHDFKVGEKFWFRNSSALHRIGFPKRNIGPFNIKELRGTETVLLEKHPGGPFLHFTSSIQHASDLKRAP